ncbi:NUDIX hydrolase [Photobacterium halotolerans]|uniref:GDP-mannose pyrophosphatase n=1 Tax=Photobacterium halotolerans TaxID=265726 RepID=A0A7X4WBV7_9GAMM|nr:NUDIX hydrolase [Photobacterium halotolerans]NAW65922.1 NUDIX domain-containing protein [Photobacterium halotolerans]NAW88467.1 NUDIX domain-containing protein [Photobacterium halotolerans]NAX48929.1 NUDIX domain-containing protein [Photobacterium halotolerans]
MKSQTLCQWKGFSVEQGTHQLPDGRDITFTTVRHPGAVVIVPVTAHGELVLLRQYRPAIGRWILEFPAGTLEKGEEIAYCAKRELAEETQLAASEWLALGELLPVPGFCDEVQHVFLAKGLSPAEGDLDADEILEVVTMTVEAFTEKVVSNEIQDAKTLAVFLKLQVMGLI